MIRLWGPARTEVWQASAAFPPPLLWRMEAVLSVEEAARADRYSHPELRAAFVARRGLLRLLLWHATGLQPGTIPLGARPGGKPEMRGPGAVRFSLSHSGDTVLFVFSPDTEVGVDVEAVRPDWPVEEVAVDHFSPAELALFRRAPENERPGLFCALWARKEACAKALGTGLKAGLKHLEVLGPPKPQNEATASIRMGGGQLEVWDLRASPGTRAAVAVALPGRPGKASSL